MLPSLRTFWYTEHTGWKRKSDFCKLYSEANMREETTYLKRHVDTQTHKCTCARKHTHIYNFKYFLKSTVIWFHLFWPSLVLLSYFWLNSPHHTAWYKQSMVFKDITRIAFRKIYLYLHSYVLQNSLYGRQHVLTFTSLLFFYSCRTISICLWMNATWSWFLSSE